MDVINYRPIGIIHSPFKRLEGTPIQAIGGSGEQAQVEILPEFVAGLQDLDGFSHIMLFYHCHLARPYRLLVKPFLDSAERGLFATRSPSRPNPIGFSIVRLIRIAHQMLYVEDIDIVDRTPLLDIKPLVPEFDIRQVDRIGWLEKKAANVKKTIDDGRFGSQ